MSNMVLILDNIRSVQNVGSIFRTADGAGVEEIVLAGYTPAPIDRFGRARNDFVKASLGAEKTVAWRSVPSVTEAIQECKEKGYEVVAVEQDKRAIDYREYKPKERIAFILGNEVDGLSHETLSACDVVIEIPMMGMKESLNVSVAAGVILFGIQK